MTLRLETTNKNMKIFDINYLLLSQLLINRQPCWDLTRQKGECKIYCIRKFKWNITIIIILYFLYYILISVNVKCRNNTEKQMSSLKLKHSFILATISLPSMKLKSWRYSYYIFFKFIYYCLNIYILQVEQPCSETRTWCICLSSLHCSKEIWSCHQWNTWSLSSRTSAIETIGRVFFSAY